MHKNFSENQWSHAGSSSLLLMVVITIFVLPVFPLALHRLLYNIAFTIIFFLAMLAIEKRRSRFYWMAVVAVVSEWVSFFLDLPSMMVLSVTINIFFFIFMIIILIIQVARTQEVNLQVIAESVNGYLLLGFAFALVVTVIASLYPDSYNFVAQNAGLQEQYSQMSNYVYFTFTTFTTLGYGDIVPKIPLTKSLAILTSVSGQVYLAIIIAMLVGKFSSKRNDK